MRILHVADRVSERGGADVHLLGVMTEQAKDHVVLCATGRVELDSRVDSVVVPELATREDVGAGAVVSTVETFRPDVIHVHNVMNPAILRWAVSAGAVITVQDHRAFCPGQGKWTLRGETCERAMSPTVCHDCFEDATYRDAIVRLTDARRDALSRARAVVVLSAYMKRELALVGIPPERIHVVPPFVWGLAARPVAAEMVAVVGRVVRAKGIDDAIEAWRRADVGLPLVFVGTGTERARIEALGFRVTGWLDRAALAETLARTSAVMLSPRWQEPFGIAGLEALTLGVPVAAWRSGGIDEWHPSPVPYGDVDALAASLRSLIGTHAAAPAGFDSSTQMKRLEQVYLTPDTRHPTPDTRLRTPASSSSP